MNIIALREARLKIIFNLLKQDPELLNILTERLEKAAQEKTQ